MNTAMPRCATSIPYHAAELAPSLATRPCCGALRRRCTTIATRIQGDLYVSLGEPVSDTGAWGVRVYIKPFVDWIWAGAFIMALGGFIAIGDRRYRVAVKSRVGAWASALRASP